MTSKHLFFKVMREDLRHKTWMIALSVLGSFLILPVAWLIVRNNIGYEYYIQRQITVEEGVRFVDDVYSFYSQYLIILGGIFTIAGAFIVGLFGFRHLFHKNMVDTWHSVPIKRSTLYGVCWLNGFLIWFLPFLACMIVTLVMTGGFVADVCQRVNLNFPAELGIMVREGMWTLLVLFVVFLLVYHLVLIAVMLSGNVLNTLISMLVFGFGVIGVYGLGIVFFSMYMDTFYVDMIRWENVTYASPLFSACYLLYVRVADYSEVIDGNVGMLPTVIINLIIAFVLGGCAWYLHQRRASELAEQGIKNKPAVLIMKLIVGVAGGMCGWLLLVLLNGNSYTEIWGVFGAVLVSILVFGILDIIFCMDFKAFFSHKIQMAVTTVVALILCFAFYGDWFGYDKYLPDKEEIVELAIFDNSFANRYFYGTSNIIEEIHLKDLDAGYAFLERVTGRTEANGPKYSYNYGEAFAVKVTLESGRTYYRNYVVTSMDKDVVWPLVSSEEYLMPTYYIDEENVESCYELLLERFDSRQRVYEIDKQQVRTIVDAYNNDLLNNTDLVLMGGKVELVQVTLEIRNQYDYYSIYLDVYEGMENTIRALQECGYGNWVEKVQPTQIQSMELYLGFYPDLNATPEELIALAREAYQVFPEGKQANEELFFEALTVDQEVFGEPMLVITDQEEIAELLEVCSYTSSFRNSNLFAGDTMSVHVYTKDGKDSRFYIKAGTLPEKFILKFGELDLKSLEMAE